MEVYIIFIQELKTALASIGKQIIVTVHAKPDPIGDWSGSEAHDYFGIGQAADAVRIMGYDFHCLVVNPVQLPLLIGLIEFWPMQFQQSQKVKLFSEYRLMVTTGPLS